MTKLFGSYSGNMRQWMGLFPPQLAHGNQIGHQTSFSLYSSLIHFWQDLSLQIHHPPTRERERFFTQNRFVNSKLKFTCGHWCIITQAELYYQKLHVYSPTMVVTKIVVLPQHLCHHLTQSWRRSKKSCTIIVADKSPL